MRRLDPDRLGQHLDRLFRAAWALCGNRDDAEDLVQETYARVLARPRVLRGDDELAYLMQVLRNTFLTSRRTASRRPRVAENLEDFDAPDPRSGGRPEEALAAGEVFEAISALPESFRLALVAVDIAGLSYREAAQVLGTREATITTRLYRARQQVVRSLGPDQAPAAPPTDPAIAARTGGNTTNAAGDAAAADPPAEMDPGTATRRLPPRAAREGNPAPRSLD